MILPRGLRTFGVLALGLATVLSLAAFRRPPAQGREGHDGHAVVHRVSYQLHMMFFSHEAGISPVIDPQMFVSSPGAPPATGPQGIYHVADIAPAPMRDPARTPLLSAGGAPLKVLLGPWESARGRTTLICRRGAELAESQFRNLIPRGVYSLFVVHFAVSGAGRFTPLGGGDGAQNSFVANRAGHGRDEARFAPCLTSAEGVVLVWHSDGLAHGASIGSPGYTSHNQLIFQVP
jgi:hypothetical protein